MSREEIDSDCENIEVSLDEPEANIEDYDFDDDIIVPVCNQD